MTQKHPITPPPELVQQWASESLATQNLCNRAAQWGADQAARRPNPPSLKEQSLKHLDVMERDGYYLPEILEDLRRAVEMAPDE